VDAKRAKIFNKLARNIMSATRTGGAEMDTNLKLKYAVEKARAANMPKDNIERVIKRAAGSKDSTDYEELTYEGYGPGGVAIMVTCLTNNRNRTAPDIKYIFERRDGNMGSTGSVSFMFDFLSIFVVECGAHDEDSLMELALEAGADDIQVDKDIATILAAPTDFLAVKESLDEAGLTMLSAETGYMPQTRARVEERKDAAKILKLIESLEENDDVQNVYSNYEIPDEWIEELQA
jgi:YebC/PmpR family DNA-binding regulatory protein